MSSRAVLLLFFGLARMPYSVARHHGDLLADIRILNDNRFDLGPLCAREDSRGARITYTEVHNIAGSQVLERVREAP